MHRALRAGPQGIQSDSKPQFKSAFHLAVVFDNPAHLLQCLARTPRDTTQLSGMMGLGDWDSL